MNPQSLTLRSLLIASLAISPIAIWSAPVSLDEAQDVASAFLSKAKVAITTDTLETDPMDPSDTSTSGTPQAKPEPVTVLIESITPTKNKQGLTDFYTIRFVGGGWVILSAEDRANPILGYSTTGTIPENSFSDAFSGLMAEYQDQIAKTRIDSMIDMAIENRWKVLRYEAGRLTLSAEDTAYVESAELLSSLQSPELQNLVYTNIVVAPLMSTKWNQDAPWNLYAPSIGGPGGRAYAGCVATAMGQVMKYHNHPSVGAGSRNGRNFGSTTYNWDNMPNLSSTNDVATLLRDAGAAVDMGYGAGGSGAHVSKVGPAFTTYFKYKNSAQVQRQNYSATAWNSLMKQELSAGRPIFYAGYNSSYTSGHAFVMDGYRSDDYFHFNFGWSGYGDGWFSTANITAGGHNFSTKQEAVIGTIPDAYRKATGQTVAGLQTNGNVYVSGDLRSITPHQNGNAWELLSPTLTHVMMAELDGDNKKDELVGRDSKGYWWYTLDRQTWTKILNSYTFNSKATLPSFRTIGIADLNGDGKDDLFGLNATYAVVYTTNLGASWTSFASTLRSVQAKDVNGDEQVDFFGLDASLMGRVSTDRSTWTSINTTLKGFKSINADDINGDGNLDFWGIDTKSLLFYSTNGTSWTQHSKQVLLSAKMRDQNGDGSLDSWVGIANTRQLKMALVNDTTWDNWGGAWVDMTPIDLDGSGQTAFVTRGTANDLWLSVDSGISYKLPGQVAKYQELTDWDGDDSRNDILILNTAGKPAIAEVSPDLWINNALGMVSGDFNSDGEHNDLVLLGADGYLRQSIAAQTWTSLSSPIRLRYIESTDRDGNGKVNDLLGIGIDGNLYHSGNLSTWTKVSYTPLSRAFKAISGYDADNNGSFESFVGVNTSSQAIVKVDTGWRVTTGPWRKVLAANLDGGSGFNDLVGLLTTGLVRKSTDGGLTWTSLPTGGNRDIDIGDFDSDGQSDDIAALNSAGKPVFTTNHTTWTPAGTVVLVNIKSADLDGDGFKDDLIGQNSKGNVLYTTDRISWFDLGASFKYFALGDFQDLLNEVGELAQSTGPDDITATETPNVPVATALQIQALNATQIRIAGPVGSYKVEVVGANGSRDWLGSHSIGNQGFVDVQVPLRSSGVYWIRAEGKTESTRIPWARIQN